MLLKRIALSGILLQFAGPAHAWDIEVPPEPIVIEYQESHDYLQQRIETRRIRADAQRAERQRILRSMRENDRRVDAMLHKKTTQEKEY